jgi:hypothetical protein
MPGGTSMPEVLAELMLGPPSNKVSAASAVLSTFGNADVLGMVASSVLGGGDGGGGGGGGLGDFAGNLVSFMQFQTPGEGEADIFPGRRHALPSGRFEWVSRMAVPGVRRGARAGHAGAGALGSGFEVCAALVCAPPLNFWALGFGLRPSKHRRC